MLRLGSQPSHSVAPDLVQCVEPRMKYIDVEGMGEQRVALGKSLNLLVSPFLTYKAGITED